MTHVDRIEAVYTLPLPRAQKDLLLYLVHRASFKTWRCSPSIPTILQHTGLNRRTFLKARRALKNTGYLVWIQRRINSTHNDTDEYLILPPGRCKTAPRGVGAKLHRKPTTMQTLCTVCRRYPPMNGENGKCWTCWHHDNPRRNPPADIAQT